MPLCFSTLDWNDTLSCRGFQLIKFFKVHAIGEEKWMMRLRDASEWKRKMNNISTFVTFWLFVQVFN